jgi:hypothetical protein
MTTVDRSDVRSLAANSPSLDEFAVKVFTEVGKLDIPGRLTTAGVVFSATDGTTSFRASVHKVDLVVRYEQEIRMSDGQRALRGVFRARLDEPVKADQIEVGSFSFDSFGTTESPGGVINHFYKQFDRAQSILEDVAYWLAYEVQQYIQVKPTEKREARVTNFKL